jgi:hypothetical protein
MLNELELKTVEKRLDAIKDSVTRTRKVLIVMTVACAAMLFAVFNSNLSRIRTFAVDQKDMPLVAVNKTYKDIGTEILISDFYKSRNITVGLLGISINVTDLPVLGGTTLVVITIWYFYSYRHSNRLIVELLNDVNSHANNKEPEKDNEKTFLEKNKEKSFIELRNFIYQSITMNSVFTKSDTLTTDNSRASADKAYLDRISNWLLSESDQPISLKGDDTNVQSEPLTFSDKIVKFMFYLPFWTLTIVILRELLNLLSPSTILGKEVQMQCEFVYFNLCSGLAFSMYNQGHYFDLGLTLIFIIIGASCAAYLRILCNGCLAFSRASNESLWKFKTQTEKLLGNLE